MSVRNRKSGARWCMTFTIMEDVSPLMVYCYCLTLKQCLKVGKSTLCDSLCYSISTDAFGAIFVQINYCRCLDVFFFEILFVHKFVLLFSTEPCVANYECAWTLKPTDCICNRSFTLLCNFNENFELTTYLHSQFSSTSMSNSTPSIIAWKKKCMENNKNY